MLNPSKALTLFIILMVAFAGIAPAGFSADNEFQAANTGILGIVGSDFGRFVTSRNTAVLLGMGLSIGLLSSTFDNRIASSPINSEMYEDNFYDGFFELGEFGGSMSFLLGSALTTHLIGKLGRNQSVSYLGSDLLRAQVVNGLATQIIKRTVQRQRPDASNKRSFPSGHTSGAFAAATVLHRHLGWKAGALAYTLAGYIGASRLSENKHYLSDVIMGAAIGIASGLSISGQYHGSIISLHPQMNPGGAGLQISIAFP